MSQSRSQPNEGRRRQLAEDGIIVLAARPRRLPAEKVKLSSGPSIAELIAAERR